ncbi:SRPBCC family protein [Spirosoma foliorum]|uniref:SRPBCC domain-containing protein n=1 Tax=Spirosoma foliorum TaxID=2710596 RepID=A0A7G5GZN4_9BACT|nr:SRPBCC family protein [Spirosoma foliorum]QMW04326.1 SRPBCC domain-containing protein [Spirosoma foliorum]
MATEFIPTIPDCEIVTSRIIHAPRKLVFRAWTEPDHLKNWWGPAGFTNTFTEFDLRVGGRWSFIMHGPEKGNYPNECEFLKIEEPALIAWKRYLKPLFRVVATFEEITLEQTKVTLRQIFDTAEEREKIEKFTVGKNDENFDRLEVELEEMAA